MKSKYFIIVIGQGIRSYKATLYFFKKNKEINLIERTICYIGGNGWAMRSDIKGKDLTKIKGYKKEGDKKTPMGLFTLGRMFSHDLKKKSKNGKEPSNNPNLYCYEDLNEVYECCYPGSPVGNRRNESEKMTTSLYKRAIFIKYNYPIKNKNAGSCIFMHVGNRKTAGCVAVGFTIINKIFQLISPHITQILMIPSKKDLKFFPKFNLLKKFI